MDLSALILADSRFPGGGHVHSGGLEEVVARKLVTSVRDLPGFLSGRLRTAGYLAAVFAAASAHAAANRGNWSLLDSELDARTPSLAQREASRAQGRGTARAGRIAWPSPVLEGLLAETPRPHHPIVLGALVGVAGGSPYDAAMAVAYLSVSGPASAAVRLLGLDPFAVVAYYRECRHTSALQALLPPPAGPRSLKTRKKRDQPLSNLCQICARALMIWAFWQVW